MQGEGGEACLAAGYYADNTWKRIPNEMNNLAPDE
jgi:hypothetical protein